MLFDNLHWHVLGIQSKLKFTRCELVIDGSHSSVAKAWCCTGDTLAGLTAWLLIIFIDDYLIDIYELISFASLHICFYSDIQSGKVLILKITICIIHNALTEFPNVCHIFCN